MIRFVSQLSGCINFPGDFEVGVFQKNEKTKIIETFLSFLILAVIIVIGTGIFLTHYTYNPAVESLEKLRLLSKSPGTVKKSSATQLLFTLPEGLVPLSPPELFDAENLSDKIDGKAELYLSAGFVRLQTQRFKEADTPDMWFEAYAYDMGANQNAFAVYSAQRRDDAQSLNLTRYSYRAGNALFFVHGAYYVEIIASATGPQTQSPMESFAGVFIRHKGAEKKSITPENLFPKTDLVESSISLIATDAFGFDRFDRVFTAVYKLEDSEIMVFLSNRKSNANAAKLAQAYFDFLLAFDGLEVQTDLPIKGARMIDILKTFEIIFSQGPYVAGVREAQDKDRARELAMRLVKKLNEVTGGS
jgi:hypothetical protein